MVRFLKFQEVLMCHVMERLDTTLWMISRLNRHKASLARHFGRTYLSRKRQLMRQFSYYILMLHERVNVMLSIS
jgi:hypothetical protein